MAIKTIFARIRARRGSYENWHDSNPVLWDGELSYVSSAGGNNAIYAGKFKIGDGKTPWRNLPFNAARFPEDTLYLDDAAETSALPSGGTVVGLFQQIRNFLKWALGRFNPFTGHRHNGGDSPRISYADLSDTHIIRAYVDHADYELGLRIDSVENLGQFVGSFADRTAVPENKSGFPNGITINDFVTVQADEYRDGAVTRYVAVRIEDEEAAEPGAITWVYDVTYSLDISGKADKVSGAGSGNFAALNAGGNLTDSGKKAADFIPAGAKGAANGVASLGADGLVPASQLPEGGTGGGLDISGLARAGTYEGSKCNAFNATDHTFPQSGIYDISDGSVIGLSKNVWYHLIHMVHGSLTNNTYCAQIASKFSSPTELLYRANNGYNWSAWIKINNTLPASANGYLLTASGTEGTFGTPIAQSTFLTPAQANAAYLTPAQANAAYLTPAAAASTYLTPAAAANNYFAKTKISLSSGSTLVIDLT